ncbi:hypothetical protein I2486_07350 [Cellulophaga sp. E16_2]|uniref:hypothetical protein n=1 Tax=Cellulophaga sp. E16_2 TaxID=2789297 RepID=UPI001A9171D1|nr:hypothetical protein [Cellulophaga sp. E16_2]MBO0591222.1 hypothetical protein [Cellulophaga sp. E16_2]
MKKIVILIVILVIQSCNKDDNESELTAENPTAQLEGTWEYYRGVVFPCESFDEIDDYPIDSFNRNIWKSDGSFYREYNDDGTLNSYSGKWTFLEKVDGDYKYKTEIDGISGSDTTYVRIENNKLLVYDKDCFNDSSYEPSFIREAGEARKVN